jgi:hypothetical protein
MNEKNIAFQTIDWTTIPKVEYRGETGSAFWQTVQFPGFLSSHRSISKTGVKLMIIDDDFLKQVNEK